jgi:hypothetical protein
MSDAAITFGLLIAAAVGWIWLGRASFEKQLEMLCGDDPTRANQLIEAEMKKTREMSRAEAAKAVVQRMRRESA